MLLLNAEVMVFKAPTGPLHLTPSLELQSWALGPLPALFPHLPFGAARNPIGLLSLCGFYNPITKPFQWVRFPS